MLLARYSLLVTGCSLLVGGRSFLGFVGFIEFVGLFLTTDTWPLLPITRF